MNTKRILKIILLAMTSIMLVMALCFTGFASEEVERLDNKKFAGKKIGISTGSFYIPLADSLIDNPEVSFFQGDADAINAVKEGKIDATLLDLCIGQYIVSQTSGLSIGRISDEPSYFGVVGAKDEHGRALMGEFNAFLAEYEQDGKLKKLQDKWFTGPEEERVMEIYRNPESTKGTIRMAVAFGFPPFDYVKNGEIVGYNPELISEFCKYAGYDLELISMEFVSVIPSVISGKSDFGTCIHTITEERKETVLFSEPVLANYAALVYRSEDAVTNESFMDGIKASFRRTFVTEDRWKLFVDGVLVTLLITVVSIIAGSALGFGIHMICRTGKKIPNLISRFCRWLVEGMPVIVFLMILFYIIFKNSKLSGMWVATIGFSIIFACFVQGMLEAGERAVDKGQYVAAKIMGYSESQSFFLIILPQALQYSMPEFFSELSTHIKATAVVGYIAVMDITKAGDLIRGMTYDPFFPLISVAILYFVMAGVLRLVAKTIVKRIERKQGSEEKIMKGIRPL